MSVRITMLSEDIAAKMTLPANSIMSVPVSISGSRLPSRALCLLSLRAKRGSLLSPTEILADYFVSLAMIEKRHRS
jgi:hypothetical protein